MAGKASDFKRGSMNMRENNATYAAFMAMFYWGGLATAVGILFFTILFCTPLGLLPAGFFSGALAVVGGFVLSRKPAH